MGEVTALISSIPGRRGSSPKLYRTALTLNSQSEAFPSVFFVVLFGLDKKNIVMLTSKKQVWLTAELLKLHAITPPSRLKAGSPSDLRHRLGTGSDLHF